MIDRLLAAGMAITLAGAASAQGGTLSFNFPSQTLADQCLEP
jgi:hypothetical protein